MFALKVIAGVAAAAGLIWIVRISVVEVIAGLNEFWDHVENRHAGQE